MPSTKQLIASLNEQDAASFRQEMVDEAQKVFDSGRVLYFEALCMIAIKWKKTKPLYSSSPPPLPLKKKKTKTMGQMMDI